MHSILDSICWSLKNSIIPRWRQKMGKDKLSLSNSQRLSIWLQFRGKMLLNSVLGTIIMSEWMHACMRYELVLMKPIYVKHLSRLNLVTSRMRAKSFACMYVCWQSISFSLKRCLQLIIPLQDSDWYKPLNYSQDKMALHAYTVKLVCMH